MKVEKKGCGSQPGFDNQIYLRGCLQEFEDRFKSNIGIVGGTHFNEYFCRFLLFACADFSVSSALSSSQLGTRVVFNCVLV